MRDCGLGKAASQEGFVSVGIMCVKPLFEDETLYERCFAAVSEERQTKALKIKNHNDRCRSVGAALLLGEMVRRCVKAVSIGEGADMSECADRGARDTIMKCSTDRASGEGTVCSADRASGEGTVCSADRASGEGTARSIDRARDEGVICSTDMVRDEEEARSIDRMSDEEAAYEDAPIQLVEVCVALENESPARDWKITYGAKGKPEFDVDLDTPIYFNMAHSGDYVACAVADTPVGIDIEGERKADMRVAKRYFTEKERETIQSDADFFRIWTFKEALGKCTGEGVVAVLGVSEEEVCACGRGQFGVRHYENDGYQICTVFHTRLCT